MNECRLSLMFDLLPFSHKTDAVLKFILVNSNVWNRSVTEASVTGGRGGVDTRTVQVCPLGLKTFSVTMKFKENKRLSLSIAVMIPLFVNVKILRLT